MRFGVLGPLEVVGDDGPVRIGGPKEQALLAALVMRANEAVSVTQLAEDLWGDNPPRTAAKTIQAYISRVRRAAPGARIVTAGAGYRLDVEPDDVDANRFARLAFEGRRVLDAGDAATAAGLFDDALGLWRGEPLSEFDDAPFAQAEATRLNELRLTVVEDRVAAGLALGQGARLVSELQRLVRAHPLRERLWGQLMVALYQSGRQSDALTTFQMARRYLIDEMGLEPGEELRHLERAILEHDPSLRAPAPPQSSAETTTVTVTILLTDIESSTRLWEAEPAAMAGAVELHEGIIERAVDDNSGQLLKTRGEGDATFSVFQRATDAAAAAVAMQLGFGAIEWPTSEALRVRVAIHTGEVQARGGDFYGRAVNRTARLKGVARGGEVLMSSTTAGLVADAIAEDIELVDLGSHELRDIARPEHVFALWHRGLGPRPRRARSTAALPAVLATSAAQPIVGRKTEVDRVLDAWRSAEDRVSLVLVAGEPGIGKSRLIAEVATAVAADGGAVAYGRCDEQPLTSFQPFVEVLDQLAASIPFAAIRDALDDAPELRRLVPHLAKLSPEHDERVEVPGERLRMFDAVADLLAAAAAARPLVVAVDDLHWADEATLRLLRHVLRADSNARILVLAAFRATDLGRAHPLAAALPELTRDVGVDRINLRGLSPDDVATVIGDAHLHLVEDLWRATNGNAFFVVEVARHLADGGGGDVPQSVKHVVGQRVARLGEHVDRLLSAAAVAGPEFDLEIAARVATLDDNTALEAADAAVAAGLLRPLDGDRLSFAHSLVRQTLYEELTPSRRIRMHRLVAEAIETLYGDALDDWSSALAFHWAAAGDQTVGGPAYRYAMLAGDRAASLVALEEAAEHYRRAVDIAEAAGDGRGQVAALIELGESLQLAGDAVAADPELVRAMDLARDIDDGALFGRAVLGYGYSARSLDSGDAIAPLLNEALERLPDEPSPLRAQVMGRAASNDLFRGQGAGLAREAYAMATELGDPLAIVMAGNACRFAGPEAVDVHKASEIARALVKTKWAIWSVVADSWVAMDAFQSGHLDRAVQLWDNLIERTRGAIPLAIAQRDLGHAITAALRGEFDEADRLTQRALHHIGTQSDTNVLFLAGSVRAAIDRIRGGTGGTVEMLESLAESRPDIAAPRLALAYALAGRREDARRSLDDLVASDFTVLNDDWGGIYGLGFLARAAARVGHKPAAARLYELLRPRSGQLLTLHGLLDCLGAVDYHLGVLAQVLTRDEDAVAHLRAALEFHERMEAPTLVAETEVALADVLTDREPSEARRLARAALDAAERIGMGTVEADARVVLRELDRPALPPALSASGLLIGRGQSLETLISWLGDRRSRLAVVSGEPGIGKTRLLAELAATAHARGWTVLYGTCDEELLVPFQPFVMAIPVAKPVAPPGAIDPEVERYRWFEDVVDWLRAAGPTLLVLDDLHWADGGTLALLRHVLHADGLNELHIVGAYRDTDLERSRPLGRFLAERWAEMGPIRVDLRGLARADVEQLLDSAADATAVHAETEGNPLFVTLVARHLREGGRGVPQGIRDVVGRRLDRLSDDAVHFLRVAALVGREFELGAVADAAEVAETAALAAIDEAAERGLISETGVVDRFAFTHALIAASLVDELTTSRRVRLHRRLGEALEARAAQPSAVARHFCEAAVTGVADKAVRYARQAAEDALIAGAWEEAARWRAAALDALDAGDDDIRLRAELEIELGETLAFCGDAIDARVHFDRGAALARKCDDVELLGRAAVAYVGESIKTSMMETGEDVRLDEALAAIGPEDTSLRSRLLAQKARWNSYIGDHAAVIVWAEEAYRIAKVVDDPLALFLATGVLGLFRINQGSAAMEEIANEGLDFARRTGDLRVEQAASSFLVAAAVRRGNMADARRLYARVEELAAMIKTPRARWSVELSQAGLIDTIAGDWEAAEVHAQAALDASAGLSANPFLPLGVYLSQLIPIRWLQGRLSELADQFKWAAETSVGPLLWHSAAAMALVEAGRLDEARAVLEPIRALSDERFAASVESGAMVCHLAVACRPLGERDLAARTYDRIRDQQEPGCLFMVYLFLGVYEHHRGNLAAAAGWPDVAREHLERAIEQYEAMEAPAWTAKAREDLISLS